MVRASTAFGNKMPEGPEVEVVRAALAQSLVNEVIQRISLSGKNLRRPIQQKDFKFLTGQRIRSVHRHGKFLYVMTEATQGFWCRLGMSGKLLFYRKQEAARPHTHVTLHLSSGRRLAYVDPRRFGEFFPFTHLEVLQKELLRLGPDPLHWTTHEQDDIIQKCRHTKRQIKTVLLDQSTISGVGNIYACEALFAARISPFRQTKSLRKEEMSRLLKAAEVILKQAVSDGGTSFSDYEQPDGQLGQHYDRRLVFQRAHENCKTCGTLIKVRTQHGRSTFYCPHCQNTR
jgi:formamidopyrimidine-DNA glycosylase